MMKRFHFAHPAITVACLTWACRTKNLELTSREIAAGTHLQNGRSYDENGEINSLDRLSSFLVAFSGVDAFGASRRLCPIHRSFYLSIPFKRCRRDHTMKAGEDGDAPEVEEEAASGSDLDADVDLSRATERKPCKKRFALASDLLDAASHAGAAACAGIEILEDAHELSIHAGHGVILLVSSKICDAMNELLEETQDLKEELRGRFYSKTPKAIKTLFKPFAFVLRKLTSKVVTATLSFVALASAFNEVIAQTRPGGHHGLVLLAISNLLDLLQSTRLVTLQKSGVLLLTLAVGAAVGATIETLESLHLNKIGTHHGVLLLAIAKLLALLREMREDLEAGRTGFERLEAA
mmetsp:Transcript_9414/g.15203  ORF Transcript_9414/g.15203 Transcript_9414/m.15203 type:complete len:351 (-) Transcript_9414:148-1200(-)